MRESRVQVVCVDIIGDEGTRRIKTAPLTVTTVATLTWDHRIELQSFSFFKSYESF